MLTLEFTLLRKWFAASADQDWLRAPNITPFGVEYGITRPNSPGFLPVA